MSNQLLKKDGGGWDNPLLAHPSLQKVIGGRVQLGLSQPPP